MQDTSELVAKTAHAQEQMWSVVKTAAAADPNPVLATIVVGMNDVRNRKGYSQAACWNPSRFPPGNDGRDRSK